MQKTIKRHYIQTVHEAPEFTFLLKTKTKITVKAIIITNA